MGKGKGRSLDVFVAEDEERIFGGILGTLGGGLVGGAVGNAVGSSVGGALGNVVGQQDAGHCWWRCRCLCWSKRWEQPGERFEQPCAWAGRKMEQQLRLQQWLLWRILWRTRTPRTSLWQIIIMS